MSKKSKKINNVWDLTAEEQQEEIEKFAEFENGEVNIMSLVGNKASKGLNDKGFSAGLESLIVNDQKKKFGIPTDQPVMTDEEKDFWDSDDNEVERVYPEDSMDSDGDADYDESAEELAESNGPDDMNEEVKFNGVRSVVFRTGFPLDVVHRIVIDDGICPTVTSVDSALTEKLTGYYDADDIGDAITMLFNYIITLKHPAAIYDYNDFMNPDFWVFARIANGEYNQRRYKFFSTETQVFCYVVDDDSVNVMNHVLSKLYSEDPNEILKIFIGMAYAAGTIHQAFWIEDSEYISRLVLNSKINMQKEFHNLFSSDPTTVKIVRCGEETVNDQVKLLDAEEVQTTARGLITMLTGDGYFGDDDAYDDEEDDDEEESSDEMNQEEESEEETEFDGLGDDMEMVETEEEPEVPVVQTVPVKPVQQPSLTPEKKEFKTANVAPVKQPTTDSTDDDLDNLVIPVIRKDRG